MATSRVNGGLEIIDLEMYVQDMCANFLVISAIGWHIWAKMAMDCLELVKHKFQGGLWKGVNSRDKLMSPS